MDIRKGIEAQKLIAMRAARQAYEDELERLRIEQEETAKNKKKLTPEKKKSKKKAKQIIPISVNEFTMVDVNDDFLEIENQVYQSRAMAVNMDSLSLAVGEVRRP